MKPSSLLAGLIFTSLLAAAHATPSPSSPAEQRIALAQRAIEKNPQRHEAHAQLALAFAQRARETADTAYYDRAEAALAQSLKLAPGNLEARRVHVWVLLGKHEFARALEEARALNKIIPDDVQIYGYLADAHIELGNYDDAERAAQWMLDLRPGNIPGLARAAYLRELFGDIEGSLDLMAQAYQRTPPAEREDRAWILTHMAHLHLLDNQPSRADALLAQALELFPGYHYALAQLAKVRQAQGRLADAVALLRQHVEAAPHPENYFYLGEALAQSGHADEAAAVFKQFAAAAEAESASWDNANRELIAYYADHADRARDALKLAEAEIARRQDVYTLDAWAWALYRNGQFAQAQQAIARALAVGVRDPKLHYHAGMIAHALGAHAQAREHLETALRFAPWAEFAPAARAALQPGAASAAPSA
ncbi:MAG: tetratricopeptide repeat protein [Thiobacillus sp.]|nr:tetratricopeptide repeat protein [Thiobacillus sp.]